MTLSTTHISSSLHRTRGTVYLAAGSGRVAVENAKFEFEASPSCWLEFLYYEPVVNKNHNPRDSQSPKNPPKHDGTFLDLSYCMQSHALRAASFTRCYVRSTPSLQSWGGTFERTLTRSYPTNLDRPVPRHSLMILQFVTSRSADTLLEHAFFLPGSRCLDRYCPESTD